MKKTLIVGANSFLAQSLASKLQSNIFLLFGLLNLSDNRIDYSKYSKLYINREILFDEHDDFDYIFLTAAFIPTEKFEKSDQRYVDTNISLVYETSKKYPNAKIIFCSSISVYGNPLAETLNEESAFNNPGLYGLSKIAGEAIIKNHTSYAILRFSSIWGIGMLNSTYIPRIINQAKTTNQITIWGQGNRLQNYIHVDDASELCIAAVNHPNNITALGVYPKSYSNLELAKLISKKLNAKIIFENEDLSSSFIFVANKSYKELGMIPRIGITEYIDELL
jgi:UDP-glucose 4-epimerase